MTTISEKIHTMGFELPAIAPPDANYISRVQTGSLLYIAGQISQRAGAPAYFGRLGEAAGLSQADGVAAAQSAALGLLAQLNAAVQGDLGRVKRVVRLGVFVASAPTFTAHSAIGNGASDLLVAVLGDRGRHTRTSVGVAALPLGVAVEVDAIVEIEGQAA